MSVAVTKNSSLKHTFQFPLPLGTVLKSKAYCAVMSYARLTLRKINKNFYNDDNITLYAIRGYVAKNRPLVGRKGCNKIVGDFIMF